MKSSEQLNLRTGDTNHVARKRLLSRRGEPLFVADWDRALFIHYEVDPATLQRDVPFPLDLREGKAYVSLVAFTLRDLRLRFGGRLGRWLFKPIATHEFLNVRTYVQDRGEPGIFFLAEWLANPLSVMLGPRTFGLPYRLGRIDYRHQHEAGSLSGSVSGIHEGCAFHYQAELPAHASFDAVAGGSLDDFLVERYTAFTARGARRSFFRIWHEPWLQSPVDIAIHDDALLRTTWNWFGDCRVAGANYSPGARRVWMGRSRRIPVRKDQASGRLSTFFEIP
jgi:uncharacterized protein YqjF (DUF2071 family)